MMTINHGTAADYTAHLKACDRLFPTALSERIDLERYAEKLHDRATSFELWDGHRIVGLLSVYLDTDVAFISHICVLPEAPPRSGSRLMTALVNEAIRRHKRRIRLQVEVKNEHAVTFYQRHGFVETQKNGLTLTMEREV